MKTWTVRIGLPQGGEKTVTIEARDEISMKKEVQRQYPGAQVRNYSSN